MGLSGLTWGAWFWWEEKRRRALEAVEIIWPRALGVDGVLGEAVDDGGDGDEDGGAVFDDRDFHAGDFGVDEELGGQDVSALGRVVVAASNTRPSWRASRNWPAESDWM